MSFVLSVGLMKEAWPLCGLLVLVKEAWPFVLSVGFNAGGVASMWSVGFSGDVASVVC